MRARHRREMASLLNEYKSSSLVQLRVRGSFIMRSECNVEGVLMYIKCAVI